MSEDIYPSKEMKECIYEFYSLTYNSKFSLGKKRHLMTAALGYEKWGWRVVGITKGAIKAIQKNEFKLPKGLERDHFKQSRKHTYDEIFVNEKYNFEDWWEHVWDNDETILMTKNEHQNHKKLDEKEVIRIDYTLGYFRAGGVGMKFTKRDGEFVKELYKEYFNE